MRQRNHRGLGLLGLWVIYGILGTPSWSAAIADGPSDHPPAPHEVLERAKKSRVDFIQAIGDIERFAPTMTSSDEIFPYLLILDELEAIGKPYGFETFGVNPVRELARILTQSAGKWIRLDRVEPRVLEVYFRWAEDAQRGLVIGQQTPFINLATDVETLLRWSELSQKVLGWMRQLKAATFVVEAASEVQGTVVRKLLLRRSELKPQSLTALLQQTRSVIGLQEVLEFLIEQVTYSPDPEYLRQVISWAFILSRNEHELGELLPYRMRLQPGEVVIQALSKLMAQGEHPDIGLVPDILATLQPSQVPELGLTLEQYYHERSIPASQSDFLFALIGALKERYAQIGLLAQLRQLDILYQRVATMRLEKNFRLEGTYRGDAGGRAATLTVVNTGGGSFILDLNTDYPGLAPQGMDYPFFKVVYDARSDCFEAHHFGSDTLSSSNASLQVWYLKFRVEPRSTGNLLTGWFSSQRGLVRFSARQVQRYDRFDRPPPGRAWSGGPPPPLSAAYSGTVVRRTAELTLSQVGTQVSGVMYWPNEGMQVYFEFGFYDPQYNTIFLNSGEQENQKWVHLRGQLSPDGKSFHGLYIIGGVGATSYVGMTRFRIAN